ncbi:MAG TPA: hypothetical protein VFX96_15825, partial [Pyrinomonadaceae bacterium]|nr:hypothetical protein [Pyrinomonadaceae bacterium]
VSGATTTPADAVAATKRAAEMALALEPGWESMPGARAAETSKTAACAGASLKSLALGGVRLGMSVEEVLASLPGSERDATALHMLARSKDAPNSHGYSHAFVDASYSRDPRLSGVEKYWVKFLDGRLYAVMVIYRGAHWPGVDSFVGGMSGALGLPPAEQWERGGGGSDLRYLICDDVELRFYAAPGTNPNTDSILLADRKAERTLAERKTKAKEAATR